MRSLQREVVDAWVKNPPYYCFHFSLVGEGEERCSEFRVYAGPTVRPLDSRVTGKEPATPEDFQTRLKAELRTALAHRMSLDRVLGTGSSYGPEK
jgi:hypothetical protein